METSVEASTVAIEPPGLVQHLVLFLEAAHFGITSDLYALIAIRRGQIVHARIASTHGWVASGGIHVDNGWLSPLSWLTPHPPPDLLHGHGAGGTGWAKIVLPQHLV